MVKPAARSVAIVIPDFAGGGAQRVMLAVAAAVIADGRDATVIALNAEGPLRDKVPDGAALRSLDRPQLRGAIPALRRALSETSASVAISTLNYLNIGVSLACVGLAGAPPLILREANMPSASLGAGLTGGAKLRASRYFYRRAAGVLSPSSLVADEMADLYRISRKAIDVIHNPVDEASIRRSIDKGTPDPDANGEATKRFVAAGRLTRQKGYDRLFDDLALLESRRTTDWRLTIMGEGPDREALTAKAVSLGLADRIRFAGFVASPWAEIASADAFLLPSRWEGMPNAALEALACGTPVIATPEAGGIGEIAEAAHAEGNSKAVTLARTGHGFVDAMAYLAHGPKSAPGASLLPSAFRQNRVMGQYLALIDRVAAAGCGDAA